jgi:Tol biopolymer transport system component
MKKGSTSFSKTIKTVSQITITIPTTAALLIMITVLTGTMTTVGVVNVWAGTFPGPNGQIAFVRGPFEEHEFDEIYVMNSDGSGQTRLTDNDVHDGNPSWSPDGEKIAFDNSGDNSIVTSEIYVMNSDGSGQTRLTDNDAADEDPSWSPDGEKIAFDSVGEDGNSQIYVMNAADGSDVTRLTDGGSPSWSPDGEKIAFARDDDIYVMNSDGSGQTRLTVGGGSPSWSPDGEKIAFQSHRDVNPDFAGPEIYVMNAADGSDVTRLTDNDSNDFSPDWGTNTSPPGSGPSTPAQLIDKLTSTIQNLDDNVPQSVKTSLTELLKGVSHILNDDNPNNDKAACGMLDAFIKLVNVNERLNMLTADQADDLRTQAQDIRNALGC